MCFIQIDAALPKDELVFRSALGAFERIKFKELQHKKSTFNHKLTFGRCNRSGVAVFIQIAKL